MPEAAALVTGASSGLGRAVALELARRRRRLVLVARDPERLASVARDAASAGGEAGIAATDVRDASALGRAIDRALAGGTLDLVVHAAGVLALRPVDRLTDDDFRDCLETNVIGTSHVVQAVLPHLERTRGRLVLVSSVAGLFGLPGGFGAYAASKWAVRGYAETVRAELRARGVGLTVAYPSILDTPMVRDLGPEAPAVYRTFAWHSPERAAAAIVRDALRGRRECFVSAGDRFAAAAARLAPRTFAFVLETLVARHAQG